MDKQPKTKVCNRCRKRKLVTQFYKEKAAPLGLHRECKTCSLERAKSRRKRESPETRQKRLGYQKQWRESNSDRRLKYQREYQSEKKERFCEYTRNAIKSATNSYLASLLGVSVNDVPAELLEAKRVHLQIKRMIKEKQRGN